MLLAIGYAACRASSKASLKASGSTYASSPLHRVCYKEFESPLSALGDVSTSDSFKIMQVS